MVRKPKRQSGAGRPSKGDFTKLASVLSVRMPADMRAKLETAAARRHNGEGWSLTQEMLHRLQRSFDRERDERRDPASRSLCYLLAEVVSAVAGNTAEPGQWRFDPFAFRAIKLAFTQILEALEPKGEIRAPEPEEGNPFAAFWGGPGGSHTFTIGGKTPEDMGTFIRDVILMRLSESPADDEPVATASRPRSQQEFEFGMSDARRHLRPTKEPKP